MRDKQIVEKKTLFWIKNRLMYTKPNARPPRMCTSFTSAGVSILFMRHHLVNCTIRRQIYVYIYTLRGSVESRAVSANAEPFFFLWAQCTTRRSDSAPASLRAVYTYIIKVDYTRTDLSARRVHMLTRYTYSILWDRNLRNMFDIYIHKTRQRAPHKRLVALGCHPVSHL